jgi:uncharacterized protein
MTDLPEDERREPEFPAESAGSADASSAGHSSSVAQDIDQAPAVIASPSQGMPADTAERVNGAGHDGSGEYDSGPQLFESFSVPPAPPRPPRIPHFGHLLIVIALAVIGLFVSIALMFGAVHFHLLGVTSLQQSGTEIHYILGSELVIYLVTLCLALLVFPSIWHQGLFAGLQWNGSTARRRAPWLVGAALACGVLAWLNGYLIPSPSNTPIEKVFRTPGAAWLLFAFGVTMAPFFEEMFFRGFLLPSLCTAYDWISEKITRAQPPLLAPDGHPRWSVAAMAVGSIGTSVPFAAMHAAQTGYAMGPFFLLVGVSLVLCAVRLATRSLASSVLVHACYNFLLFSLMLIGTDGFRHLDKM